MKGSEIYRPIDEKYAHESAMRAFVRFCEQEEQFQVPNYLEFQEWAARNYVVFWWLFLRWSTLPVSGEIDPVITELDCERGKFFPNVRLNYSRCLLRSLGAKNEDQPAIVGLTESDEREVLTRRQLRNAVEKMAGTLSELGIGSGDRVVAIARNTPAAVIACLGAAAIGAIWSAVAPDMGETAVLDRFRQLRPKLLFSHTEYIVHGAKKSLVERIGVLVAEIPEIEFVATLDNGTVPKEFRDGVRVIRPFASDNHNSLPLEQWLDFPFNQPLFVLFSSGTTGLPKCLMHGVGGTLLEHYKEHVLHSSFGPGEKLYFHSSTGWMMWNWLVSALACGTEIVLFDGSPTFPTQDALLRLLDKEEVTIFGTSATYLHAIQQLGLSPRSIGRFEKLHTLQSTGSILYESQYDWVKAEFKDIRIHSISGGTDIIGCFVLGNPLMPIYKGDSQCVSLGVDVQVMTTEGLRKHGEGELVCLNPFPSRPVGIFGDSDGSRFHQTYFSENPGMWTHGDQVCLNERGSARILGRSDGTLKVRGVRIGPAEIYNIVLRIPGIAQAMAVEQTAPREPGGSRLVLLLVLQEDVVLNRSLMLQIKKELSQKGSSNHVPSLIMQVRSLPMTYSGKFSEKAVRDILNNKLASNRGAIKNPEALDELIDCSELWRQEGH